MNVKTSVRDGQKIFTITWPQKSIPYSAYAALANYFRSSSDYSKVTKARMAEIHSVVKSINQSHHSDINIDQAMSIYHMVMKEKVIKGYGRMNAKIATIAAEYGRGRDIMALSAKWDFPPLNLLRGIFLHQGKGPDDMYDLFSRADEKLAQRFLKGRDLSQFKRALRHDAYGAFNQERIARLAAENEAKFVGFFRSHGIALRTQEDLAEVQIEHHGRAIITPDILFDDTVYINNVQVRWIEFKSYCQTDVRFIYESNLKQVAKYADKWGIGAICYQLGLVEGIGLRGAIPLDGSAIDAQVHYVNDLFH